MMIKTLILILGMFLFPTNLLAQETETTSTVDADTTEVQEEEPQTQSSGAGVEKIQVTGSHIKRIDVEGPSPVLTLDREYLDKSGFNNVGDVLRDTTVASFGGYRETSLQGGAATGASTTSLRGFGAERILVLMDGKRLPTIGGGTSVDLSLIPMAAVERIEILKDGASATYGSDALGGVINVITKKNYDGASIELGSFVPDSPGGMRNDIKASYGKTFNKGSFLGVLQYRSNEETWSRDYDYAQPLLKDFSTRSSPGNWLDKDPSTGTQAGGGNDPCPAGRIFEIQPDGQPVSRFCGFDYSPYSQITPSIDQYSALLSGNYEINESLNTYARGIYTHRDVTSQLAPPPDQFRDDTATGGLNTEIDQATAQGWGLSANDDLAYVRYRLVGEGGPRVSEVVSDSFALQTGVEGYMSDTWEWEVAATHGASSTTNRGVQGYYNKQILFNLVQSGDFNPFAAPNNKDDVSSAAYQPQDIIKSSMSTVVAQATGELFNLPAGPLSMAVGAQNAWQTYEQTNDLITGSGAQWGGGASAVGQGRRDIQSAYVEFALPPFTGMEVQLAGRFDNYSDFGSTFNPKLGLRYKPIQALLFRGSFGTGYRAPSLQDLYQTQTTGFPFGSDPVTGQETQFEALVGGNPDLKEETTQSYNVGFVLQLLRDLSFVVDYWGVHQENVVTDVTTPTGMRNLFRAERAFGRPYLQSFGLDVIRNSTNDQIQRIIAPSVNLASKDVSGLDLQLDYSLPVFGSYKLRAGVSHSLLLSLDVEQFPGLGSENQLGYYGNPYWRNNVRVGLGNRTWDYSLVVRTIGEQNKAALNDDPGIFGKTRDHSELDLRVQYAASWDGTFAFMVQNVFDTDRPQSYDYQSTGYLNSDLYSPFGRTFGLTYRQDF